MKEYFVLLGDNQLLRGQVCKLREFRYKVIAISWHEHPDIDCDMFIQKDVKDAIGIIEVLEELGLKGKIDGALSSIDLAAPTVNAINAWCGNCTMPEKFNRVLEKKEMRNVWEKAGLFNRISKLDSELTIDEIYTLSQKMKLICKPDVAASSRGITIIEKNATREEIEDALKYAKGVSFNHLCLIEEFIEGDEFTVDMLGDSYGNVNVYGSSAAYQSKNAHNNHVGIKYHYNSLSFDNATWERIAEFGIKCYKALGLCSMFGHLEIIMKKDGSFTPIEMGARSSGFICSHTVTAASGHDFMGDYIKVLHGGKVEPGHYLKGSMSSMWFGYDIPANSDSVKETDITKFLDPRITVLFEKHDGLKAGVHYGEYIDDNDRDKFGYAIIAAPRDVLTIENVEEAEQNFLDVFLGRK